MTTCRICMSAIQCKVCAHCLWCWVHGTALVCKNQVLQTNAMLEFRSWIRKNNAEGLEPETFQLVANRYYDDRMKLLGALDFDEMLAMAERILESNTELRSIARSVYQHLLVDEFQDSNAVQIRMVKHLQDGRGNLTVVGDDAQSIYGFRGATNRAFVLLSDILEQTTVKEFTMTQNYRSRGPIIQVGNEVLQKLMNEGVLRQKDLICTIKGDAIPVQYHELGTGLAEARFIVDEIKQLHAVGYKYDDIAILCRLNNSRSLFNYEFGVLHHIKMQLAKEAIPHRVFRGRQMTNKPEYILTVEVLKFLTNPLNDGAMLTVLESTLSMRAGIGKAVIESLKQIARDTIRPVPVWRLLHDLVRRTDTATRKRNAVKKLLNWHSRVYGQVLFMSLPEALLYIWHESGISTDAAQRRNRPTKDASPDNKDGGSISGFGNRPEASCSVQYFANSLPKSGLTVKRSPASKRKAPDVSFSGSPAEVLTSPTLEALYKNSQEFLTEWTGESLFLENFGELQLAGRTSQSTLTEPRSLLSLATAAVMQLPQGRRVHAVNTLAMVNPGLSDLILSVNKCGYGPIAEFVQHLDLNSSDVAEETGQDSQVKDGQVTLSTVHGCKGLEWPVVFVAKFIENVMPITFSLKKAIPFDPTQEGQCEQMAVAAVQADARVRGKVLKTDEDVVEYLPEWLRQDGLDLDSTSEEDEDGWQVHGAGLPLSHERVADCYKKKKAKQHAEEEIRLAHVAFTRAKHRLYITSHRIAEGSTDASSLDAAMASVKGNVRPVQPSLSISLPEDPTVVTRTYHPIDEIEQYLGRFAAETQDSFGCRHRIAVPNSHREDLGPDEPAPPQALGQPAHAAVVAAHAVVQDSGQHMASGFQFMGAARSAPCGAGGDIQRTTHRPLRSLGVNSVSRRHQAKCPRNRTQYEAGTSQAGQQGRHSSGLTDSDDGGSPLPLRQHTARQGHSVAKAKPPLHSMNSTTKPCPAAGLIQSCEQDAVGSGSPVALRHLPPADRTGGSAAGNPVHAPPEVHRQGASGALHTQPIVVDLTGPCATSSGACHLTIQHPEFPTSHECAGPSDAQTQQTQHHRHKGRFATGTTKFQPPRRIM
eukprot:jgi/Ulvmu1/3230/UM015_0271.1